MMVLESADMSMDVLLVDRMSDISARAGVDGTTAGVDAASAADAAAASFCAFNASCRSLSLSLMDKVDDGTSTAGVGAVACGVAGGMSTGLVTVAGGCNDSGGGFVAVALLLESNRTL
jgi:hypothetical protein